MVESDSEGVTAAWEGPDGALGGRWSPGGGSAGESAAGAPVRRRRLAVVPGPPQALQLLQDHLQPQALDELHHIVMQALLLADAVDGDDVGVMEPGHRAGLALEAPQPPR